MKLEEIAKIKYGLSISKYKNNDLKNKNETPIKLLNQNSIINNTFIDEYENITIDSQIAKKHVLKKDDIVISLFSPEKIIIFEEDCENYVVSQNFIVVKLNEEYIEYKDIIFYFLSKELIEIWKRLPRVFTIVKMIKTDYIKEIELPKNFFNNKQLVELSKIYKKLFQLKKINDKSSKIINDGIKKLLNTRIKKVK